MSTLLVYTSMLRCVLCDWLHCTHTCTEKLIFFDVIIEDDPGDTEPAEENVPYQLSQGAVVLDMKVQDIKVMM